MKHPLSPLSRVWAVPGRAKQWALHQTRLWIARAGAYTKPSFFIIGAQKGGTTALFRFLSTHPDVVPSRVKEPHFFDLDSNYKERGLYYYRSQFPLHFQLGKSQVTFDATPRYIYHPDCPKRLHRHFPSTKMVLLLRDPIARAYSSWNMYRNFYNDPPCRFLLIKESTDGLQLLLQREQYPSFEDAVRDEIENSLSDDALLEPSFVRRGLYAKQIERYLEYFKREQIMILDSRELLNSTIVTLDRVGDHLGLRRCSWSLERAKGDPPKGIYEEKISRKAHSYLSDFYRPHNERLFRLLGRDFDW